MNYFLLQRQQKMARKKEDIPEQKTGRGWKAADLRRKSFEDLHKLWYILGKERIRLLSEKKQEGNNMKNPERIHKVKKSMGKIKRVLHERDIVYKKAEKRLAELKPMVEKQIYDKVLELETERNNLLIQISNYRQEEAIKIETV